MKARKHQLLDDALPNHALNEPLDPHHVLQHMFILLTDPNLDINVQKEPLSNRKRFLVPLAVIPHDRIFRAPMRDPTKVANGAVNSIPTRCGGVVVGSDARISKVESRNSSWGLVRGSEGSEYPASADEVTHFLKVFVNRGADLTRSRHTPTLSDPVPSRESSTTSHASQESRTWQDFRATQDVHHDGAKVLIRLCPSLLSGEMRKRVWRMWRVVTAF